MTKILQRRQANTLSPFARLMARSGRRTRRTRSILTTLIFSLL